MTSVALQAQWGCVVMSPGGPNGIGANNCAINPNSPSYLAKYRLQDSYIPGSDLNPGITPKTLKVAVHVWQDDFGGNSMPQNQQTIDYLNQALLDLNTGMWTNNDNPSDPISGVQFFSDSKLRVDIQNASVTFHQNSGLNGSALSAPGLGGDLNDAAILTDPLMEDYLMLHFVCPTCDYVGLPSVAGIAPLPSTTFTQDHFVVTKSSADPNSYNPWALAQHWAHEIGHNLDLCHTYGPQCGETCSAADIDYLSDVFQSPSECWHDGGWNCDVSDPFNSCTNNMMGSTNASGYYSPKQIGRQHRTLALESPRRYTWGFDTTPFVVQADETWDFNIKFYQDIVVPAGVTLTVECVVEFVPQAGIIVEPGGKLVVDGGVLRAAQNSHDFWRGIELHGSNLHQQFPINNPANQGMVELKNGALIEHAREAIRVSEPGVWGTHGGVVKVNDATFLNCRRSVEFLSYDLGFRNQSSFTKAQFIVNDDYRGGNDFFAHVSMWDVRGIQFRGCEFRNDQTTINESEDLGVGILALDANFSVDNVCTYPPCAIGDIEPPCNPQLGDKSSFIGLDHGIRATEASKGRSFSVKNSYFENNVCAIYVNSVNSFRAVRNEFVMGSRSVSTLNNGLELNWIGHRGIYSTSSNGFQIEENVFSNDPNAGVETEAIVVGYTEQHSDVVYRNTMNAVGHGIIGEGTCVDPTSPIQRGLSFSCTEINNNQQRDYAYRVPSNDPNFGPPYETDFCVRLVQGNHNRFTPQQNGNYDYYNWENANFDYTGIIYTEESGAYAFSNNTNLSNGPSFIGVGHGTTTSIPACQSKVYCGGIEPVKGLFKQKAALANADVLALDYVLTALIDGGAPDQLQNTVNSSWPHDAWDLRNALIAESPYLSVGTLFEVSEQNVLPDAMMLEVCLANPEATRQEGFLSFMEHEAPNTLPSNMIQLIKNSWNTESYRGQLESSLASAVTDYSVANDRIISLMSNDTIIHPNDSLRYYWDLGKDHASKYGLIKILLDDNNFTEAQDVLNAMSDGIELSEKQINERDAMLSFVSTLTAIESSGKSMNDLGASEYDQLDQLAKGGFTRAAIMAQNILCFHYANCTSPRTGGRNGARSAVLEHLTESEFQQSDLSAFPNPASTYVTLSYKLIDQLKDAQLVLLNAQGKQLNSYVITVAEGQQLWDTRQVPTGVYLAELRNAGGVIQSQRIIVQ